MKPVPPKVTDMVPAIPETGMWVSQQPTQRCVSVRAGAVGPWQHVSAHTATRSAARARATALGPLSTRVLLVLHREKICGNFWFYFSH